MTSPFSYPVPLPCLIGPVPGPRARGLVERDRNALSPSYTRDYPLVVKSALGLGVEDVDGNWFLDFTAGIAVTNTGHRHPKVVQAIQEQTQRFLHMSGTDFYYEPMIDLAEKLAARVPGEPGKRVFFTNSGTEAVEAALKLARFHTKRTRAVAFHGAFHGRTYGAMSLSASKVQHRRGFTPLLPEVHHGIFGSLESVEHLFKHTVPPEEVAAIFVEPVQGEGGYVVPPKEFLPGLRALCDRHGILLVADEVQSGIGRTGRFLALEHAGVVADIVCLAKGLASGLPLGAVVAQKGVMNWQPGNHGSTFGGNPVACAAGLATLAVLEEEKMVANAAKAGETLKGALETLKREHPVLGNVRGLGLMVAADVVDQGTGALNAQRRSRVVTEAYQRGLLLLPCAEAAIRFSPALCVTDAEIQVAMRLLSSALGAAAHS